MKRLLIPMICLVLVSCHENLKERAAREAREFTERNCPQQLDNGLVCDSMVFAETDSTLHYYYTITGEGDSRDVVTANAPQLRAALLQNFRNDVKQQTFKEAGFNYAVTIHSAKNKGQTLFDVRFTQKDYQ